LPRIADTKQEFLHEVKEEELQGDGVDDISYDEDEDEKDGSSKV